MQDENRENRTEPQEVVDWYVRDNGGREVVDCYVQPRPMPRSAEPQPPRKRSRRGLWCFLGAVGVLVAIVVTATVVASVCYDGQAPSVDGSAADDSDASSIVEIFKEKRTTIPGVKGDPAVRLRCEAQQGEKLSIQDVYEKVNPATVLVVADEGDKASVGTGVIMTADGYIVTNAHVISGGKSCWIALDTGYTYDAELVGFDKDRDLAVLKAVDAADLPAAEFGDSDRCRVGDTVYAIGNPLGIELRGTLTDGIISAINRDVMMEGRVMTLLQTNAALNNGNSGGPLINEYGQVIGINTLKMSGNGGEDEATVEGLGFALPSSDLCYVVNDIIANGRFRGVPAMGILVINDTAADGSPQVSVYSVTEGGGGAEAGLQAGDVLLAADGQTVHDTNDLMAVRRTHIADETITLTVLRDGRTFEATVTLYAEAEQ